MSNIAIIPQINLPAELLSQFNDLVGADDLDAGVSSGFPVMSIRGSKWRIVVGGEEHPIYLPDSKDLAPSIKVVLVRSNANVSKVFYAGAFTEGSDAAPDCYSNNGVAPAADSQNPQCSTCAACPQNAWGSKISPNGSKIKACADVRRVAILPSEDLNHSPILLRVPAASLGDLAAYGKALKQRKIPYSAVVTRLSFDPDAAYPKIMFNFDRVLTAEEMQTVAGRIQEPIIDDILGNTGRGMALPAPAADDKFGIPADVQAPTAPAAQAEPAPEPVAEKPKAARKSAAKAAEPAPEPAPQAAPANDLVSEVDAALAALDF